MDRGYPSRELFYTLMKNNWQFVIRYTSNSLQSIKETPEGSHFVYDAFHNFPLLLRVIKAPLPDGTIETLVTNLYEPAYTIPMFMELYFIRWALETKYSEIKNRLQIENFSGIKPTVILQDFYATMFISNIVSMFKKVVDDQLSHLNKDKHLKYEYSANRNYLIGYIIKQFLTLIQLSKNRDSIIDRIIDKGMMHRTEARPNRSSVRKKKHHRAKYSSSYKLSF